MGGFFKRKKTQLKLASSTLRSPSHDIPGIPPNDFTVGVYRDAMKFSSIALSMPDVKARFSESLCHLRRNTAAHFDIKSRTDWSTSRATQPACDFSGSTNALGQLRENGFVVPRQTFCADNHGIGRVAVIKIITESLMEFLTANAVSELILHNHAIAVRAFGAWSQTSFIRRLSCGHSRTSF